MGLDVDRLRRLESAPDAITPTDAQGLLEEVWRLQGEVARARKTAARRMRDAAVAKFRQYADRHSYTDEEVISALKSLPLPGDFTA